jgi:hypothetical protein
VRCDPALTFDILMLTCWWRSIRVLLTLMLVFVLIRGIKSARRGDGFRGGLAEA